MQLGMIGLGRMGANMVRRLMRGGHTCVVHDTAPAAGPDNRGGTAVDPALDRFQGRVSDSGEGRWTIEAAIDEAVPATVLAAALFGRFTSRGEADFQNRLLSAMRAEFGGHAEKAPPP
jgi:6-phosphogluconate dehydrogenase (decarboxylating)